LVLVSHDIEASFPGPCVRKDLRLPLLERRSRREPYKQGAEDTRAEPLVALVRGEHLTRLACRAVDTQAFNPPS
jgi:hypothetical protein